jgi:YadA head domain repeat (2 copies)
MKKLHLSRIGIATFILVLSLINTTNTQAQLIDFCIECDGNTAGALKSTAIGFGSVAQGEYSFSSGFNCFSESRSSISMGEYSRAIGQHAVSIGRNCVAERRSWAIGDHAEANSVGSLALGLYVRSEIDNAFVIGSAYSSDPLVNNIPSSLMIGFNSSTPTFFVSRTELGQDFGMVGIGTTHPLATLDVNGGMICRGFAMPTEEMRTGYVLTCNELGTADWAPAPGSDPIWSTFAINHIYRESGNVGIGTNMPVARLQIGDRWSFNDNDDGIKSIGYNATYIDGKYYKAVNGSSSLISFEPSGAIAFKTAVTGLQGQPIETFTESLFLDNLGRVGIGTQHPNTELEVNGKVFIGRNAVSMETYGLYVEDGIYTKIVKVEHPTQWSDFVFNKDYKLRPLSEVEQFIEANKHLPEVPSSAEVEENGINLGEMDAILLQKIEELTLYVIEQQKTIEELQKLIDKK